MPHLVLRGQVGREILTKAVRPGVHRWQRAVLKTGDSWVRTDDLALLVEGTVVEFQRPLLPVAVVAPHHENTIVRLWTPAPVERTLPVQHWLALIACDLQSAGLGPVISTNLPDEVVEGLSLRSAD